MAVYPQQPSVPDDPQAPDFGNSLSDPQQLSQVMQGANPIDSVSPPQQASQPDRVKQMLSNYLEVLSKNVAELNRPQGAWERFHTGFGEGMMDYAGVQTPGQRHQQAVQNANSAVKSILDIQQIEQGQQKINDAQQMVQMQRPDGTIVTLPQALMGKLGGAFIRGDASTANNAANNSTKRLLAGYNDDGSVKPLSSLSVPQQLKAKASDALNLLNKARTDALNADPNTDAGRAALAKLDILDRNARANLTRAAAAAGMESIAAQKFAKDYIDGMQDDEGNPIGLNQYKAQFGADKAPAAMLQQAEYAKGGLEQFKDARGAIEKLRAHGVLTGVPANKLEEMLFGNGLIDPTLSQEDQKLVGQARAGLGLGATAALRAHTGRGSREIYQDFVKRFGIGQGNQALDASLDQGEKLLTGYAAAGSNKAIHALRHGGDAPSGQPITFSDGGKTYRILPKDKAAFLKDHPNAR